MVEDAMLQLSTAPQLPKGHTHDADERGDVMSPPQRRAADLTKTTVPLPFMVTVIVFVVAITGWLWRIDGRMSVIDARLSERAAFDQQLKEANQRYLDQLAQTLKAQIETAGLRNALLSSLDPKSPGKVNR